MKVTKGGVFNVLISNAASVQASGVVVEDTGGYFPPGATLEEILAALGAGSSPGSFLRTTLGGVGVVQALGTLGATELIDLANANKFWGTLDQNCTITTVGWTDLKDCAISVELIQNGTGGWTPTFTGVTWIGGTPTWTTTAGTVTHVVLFSRDGGVTIYGAVVGGDGGTSVSYGSNTEPVAGVMSGGILPTLSRADHVHVGVNLVTSNGSNALLRPIANFASGSNVSFAVASNTLTISATPTASAIESVGFVGPLMISDTPSNPLVFADIMQNDDGTDFVYQDL
jgi:hypothetical protein